MTKTTAERCSLTQKDFEMIERLGYKLTDDVAVSISRAFERLEERVDGMESRIYSRIAEISDEIGKIIQEKKAASAS